MIILDLSWFVWKHDSSLHPMVDHWLITIFLPVHTSSSLKSSASCGSSTFNMIRISLISLWCGVYIYIDFTNIRVIFWVLFLFYQFHTCRIKVSPHIAEASTRFFPAFFQIGELGLPPELGLWDGKKKWIPSWVYLLRLPSSTKQTTNRWEWHDRSHTHGFVNQNFWSHWIWKKLHVIPLICYGYTIDIIPLMS